MVKGNRVIGGWLDVVRLGYLFLTEALPKPPYHKTVAYLLPESRRR